MLPLDGLASVIKRQVRLGEKLLLPGIEDIGVDGKFGADGGDGDAVLEVAKNRLGLLLCGESDFRHCRYRFSVVRFFLTLPLKNEISNVRFKGRQNIMKA